ncbi:hypothetical protein ACFVW8_20510 [Streptomyces sp. NPDC058221]|uniref:hypothetical protein n=1 Tax=Streptomyces sp. NPDC058221 TaxID=3346388 RepID=UPI0036EEA4FD
MARSRRKSRRLVVDGVTFLWRVSHRHARGGVPPGLCQETLAVRPLIGRGRLEIAFRQGPGRAVPDGFFLHFGEVGMAEGGYLNLNEPGTVRALLDEALSHGWCADAPTVHVMDGWELFDAVSVRRNGVAPGPQPEQDTTGGPG